MNNPDTIYQPYRELIVSHVANARTVNRPGISIHVRATHDHVPTTLDKNNLSFHLVGQALAALNNAPDTTDVVTDPSYDEYDGKILKANVFIAIRDSYPTADDVISRLTVALKILPVPPASSPLKRRTDLMYMLQIILPDAMHEAIDVTKIVRLTWYDGYTTIFCQDKNAVRIKESLGEYLERVTKIENMKNQCHTP